MEQQGLSAKEVSLIPLVLLLIRLIDRKLHEKFKEFEVIMNIIKAVSVVDKKFMRDSNSSCRLASINESLRVLFIFRRWSRSCLHLLKMCLFLIFYGLDC